MFAVIRTGGKQYRVAAEDTLTVGRLEGNPGDVIEITDVLAYGEGDSATIGTPTVEGVTIAAEIVSQGRHKTVIAFKKRRRQNSRRKRGQRQHETVLRISEILTGGQKPAARAAQASAESVSEAPATDAAPAKKPRAKKVAETAAATE